MKTKILALCAVAAMAGPLAFPSGAMAQGIAVHDNANLLQQISAVRQAIQIVAQGKAQIAQAQKLYQDLNKLTDIPALAQQLKTDALTAGTSKEVADLTARLSLESASMQNDQLRLQAIAFQQQADEHARAATGRAALAQKIAAASRYYRGLQ